MSHISTTWPVARKVHYCCECRRPISPGVKYRRDFLAFDGTGWTQRLCETCAMWCDRVIEQMRREGFDVELECENWLGLESWLEHYATPPSLEMEKARC